MMTVRELAELMLSGERAAARIGATFEVDVQKANRFGLTADDVRRAKTVVKAIKQYTDATLDSLGER